MFHLEWILPPGVEFHKPDDLVSGSDLVLWHCVDLWMLMTLVTNLPGHLPGALVKKMNLTFPVGTVCLRILVTSQVAWMKNMKIMDRVYL